VNLVSSFLREGLNKDAGERASIGDVVAHIERICELMGRRDGVAIGTDMDGGFSADWLPEGVRTPADLEKIAAALGGRGWSDEELSGFRFGNWARFFG
jgi:microsomal dipeptidase-like Zn-dependent dipeptidase